jgi:hypothetical protein
MMLGGKKKKNGKVGPLKPGDKPTPLPGGHKPGPSDPLPPGSKGGHLPKSKGYRPPDDMATTDIWVSPDCQAYVIGEDWWPTVEGQDPYMWFLDMYGLPYHADDPWAVAWHDFVRDMFARAVQQAADAGRDFIVYEGQNYGVNMWDFPGWDVGRFPDIYSVADAFTEAVFEEISPLCAEEMPRFEQYGDDEEAWSDAWDEWAEKYPKMEELVAAIRWMAIEAEEPEGENVAAPKKPGDKETTYIGARNLQNAWRDFWGVF